jgi:hypothetical protein
MALVTSSAAGVRADEQRPPGRAVAIVRGRVPACTPWAASGEIVVRTADDYDAELGGCTWDAQSPRPPAPRPGEVLVLVQREYRGCAACLAVAGARVDDEGAIELVVEVDDSIGECRGVGVAAAWAVITAPASVPDVRVLDIPVDCGR